jgi:tRNA dimethylallyltransferase
MTDTLLALVGPTASGKTEAAAAVAEALGAEIVSIDSTTVYRGMDVQTAKPTPEQRARVPHHLVDVADPEEPFSVAQFQRMAVEVVDDIRRRGHHPLLVGGSGLYYRAVVDRLAFPGTEPGVRSLLEAEASVVGPERLHERLSSFDPPAAERMEPANTRRVVRALEVAAITGRPFSSFAGDWERYPKENVRAAGIDVPRSILYRRIEERARADLPGLIEETGRLLRRGAGPFLTSLQAIGYAEAMGVLEGRMDRREALSVIVRRVKALARRQMAWFRRDPRIRWFAVGDDGAAGVLDDLTEYLSGAPVAAAG